MTENKETPKTETSQTSEKGQSTQIRLTLNDLMVLGFNMLKSGFGLIQSFEKVLDSKFQELVNKGDLKPEDAERMQTELKGTVQNILGGFSGKVNNGVRSTLNRLNIATLKDIQSLETRLDTLLERLDTLSNPEKTKPTDSKKSEKTAASTNKTTPQKSTPKKTAAKKASETKTPARKAPARKASTKKTTEK